VKKGRKERLIEFKEGRKDGTTQGQRRKDLRPRNEGKKDRSIRKKGLTFKDGREGEKRCDERKENRTDRR
jgi:hypothetical protein